MGKTSFLEVLPQKNLYLRHRAKKLLKCSKSCKKRKFFFEYVFVFSRLKQNEFYAFVLISSQIHKNCVHEGRRDFACSECGRELSTRSGLRLHIRKSHEKDFDRIVAKSLDLEYIEKPEIGEKSEFDQKSPRCRVGRVQSLTELIEILHTF